ncbi:hypothetical protein GCM10007890_53780 [Methylobacterium tardum]|uniref:Uncharacterized protein n=1 Tax=Methylobacterium tardum TaxID=374432 RepID=A0AA37WWJ9_9HYPH|nr:hypothetical protein GCM10007890_53780 [Methylobacterium tardum]
MSSTTPPEGSSGSRPAGARKILRIGSSHARDFAVIHPRNLPQIVQSDPGAACARKTLRALACAAAIDIACAPLHATRAKALAERADAAALGSFAGAAAPA